VASVRSHGDTKTEKSRRTLALPEMAVDALRAHQRRQAGDRAAADRRHITGRAAVDPRRHHFRHVGGDRERLGQRLPARVRSPAML